MAKDKHSNDHTITIDGDTKTLTVEDNLVVSGDLTVSGDLSGDLNVSGGVTAGGDMTVTGDITGNAITGVAHNYDTTRKVISIIPNTLFESVIASGDLAIRDSWSWLSSQYFFPGISPTIYLPHSLLPNSFLTVIIDSVARNNCAVDSIKLWIQRPPNGGSLNVTVKLQLGRLLGTTDIWIDLAAETLAAAEITGRQALEFDISGSGSGVTLDFLNNTYRLRIECDTGVEMALFRVSLLQKSSSVHSLLNKFP